MPSYNTDLFNIEPYFDDYSESKNFHKILFRPGYSVQARELTQLQTILQGQIERFGNHVFKDGSKVYGADSAFQTVDFLRVTSTSPTSSFIGYEVSSGNNVAKVIHAEEATTDDPHYILFLQVVKGSLANLIAGETLCSSIDPATAQCTTTATVSSGTDITTSGTAKLYSVTEGIFYINGFFVRTEEQHAPAFGTTVAGVRQYNNIDGVFGFDIQNNYIGSNEDDTLRDPARGYYNFNAPGSDRFQIVLDLNFHTSAERDNFVPLATLASGIITNQTIYSDYSELEKTLARRTFDESGSYITDPFELEVKAHGSSSDHVTLAIGSGKAYIFGHEFENQTTEFKSLPRARTTESRSLTQVKPFDLGDYIENVTISIDGFVEELFNGAGIEQPLPISILSDDDVKATANIVSYMNNGNGFNQFRVYLHDINLLPNKTLGAGTYELRYGTDVQLGTASSNSNIVVKADNNSLVFPVDTGSAVQKFNDINVRLRKRFAFTSVAGTATINLATTINGSNYSFVGDISSSGLDNEFVRQYYQVITTTDTADGTQLVNTDAAVFVNEGDVLTITGLPDGEHSLIATVEFKHTDSYQNGIRRKISRTDVITLDSSDVFNDEPDNTGRYYIALNRADVYKITSIISGTTDVTSDFLFDSGQRDYSYEYARLYFTQTSESKYKDETGNFNFTLVATYDYFEHEGEFGFITVDSYPPELNYSNIPLFTSQTSGKTVSLASCLDFRFVRDAPRRLNPTDPNAGTDTDVNTPLSSSCLPVFQLNSSRENDILKVAHSYYLPRIDKVVLNRDINNTATVFKILQGFPSLEPTAPEDLENSLTLYKLVVPAYTHNPADISIERTAHKRYTMGDIGEVDKRLERVEVLGSLSNIEAKIDSLSFPNRGSNTSLEADKKAILVDDFSGHQIGDVSRDDYRCSIDFQRKELRPSFKAYPYSLSATTIPAGLTLSSDGILTVNYSSTGITLAAQEKASERLSINPYQVTNWVGTITVDDPIDTWFDETKRPAIKTNSVGENNAWLATSYDDAKVGFGTQWNDWESIWSGIDSDKSVDNTKVKNLLSIPHSNDSLNSIRYYFERDLILQRTTKSVEQKSDELTTSATTFPDHIIKTLKGKVLDLSIVPYMRAKTFVVNVENMRPNTTLKAYIDNVEITNSAYITDASGTDFTSVNTTDDSGKLTQLTFNLPTSTFLSGKRILKFRDDSATTLSEIMIHSQGIYETRSQGISSVRPIIRRRQTVTSPVVPSNVNIRKSELRSSSKYQWVDPFAQTFFVDESENPRGVFLQDFDVYFGKKDSTLPITFQIRPTNNGYPHPSAIVPFSEVVVYPSSISVNTEQPTQKKTVKFKTPVYLEPGEYALCAVSNSKDYELYTATVGGNEISLVEGVSNRIQKQVYSGKLFRPQNTNIAEPDYTKDLMFSIRRCDFDTAGNKTVTLSATNSTSRTHKAHLSRFISHIHKPVDTETQVTYSLLNNAAITENSNISLLSEQSVEANGSAGSVSVTLKNGTNEISPVIDTKSSSLLHVENVINNNVGTDDDEASFGTSTGSTVRYISKQVELLNNNVANDFHVFLELIKPENTQIEVYVKARKVGDTRDFDTIRYRRLVRLNPEKFSNDNSDVVTEEFRLSDVTAQNTYSSFSVKICLYSDDATVVPTVKSMRTVALEHEI